MITIEQNDITIIVENPPVLEIEISNPPDLEIEISNPPDLEIEISNQAGLPVGGVQGQFLRKASDNNYHAEWADGSSSFYTHIQSSDSAEWIVNHNLGRYPIVSVLSVGLVEQIAEVVHVSTNQVRIYFAQPFKGMAQCV